MGPLMWIGLIVLVGIGVVLVGFSDRISASVGAFLVRTDTNKRLDKAGLTGGGGHPGVASVTLPDGAVAWYRERPATDPDAGPPLVVLGGATTDIDFIGARLGDFLQGLAGRRVVVVELPYHGRNLSENRDFSSPPPSLVGMAKFVGEVCAALELDTPFDLLGWSLGGGVAGVFAVHNPDRVNRLLMLAPFFYEAATESFDEALDQHRWREIQGWETVAEMMHFYEHWLGLKSAHQPPGLVINGLHALRTARYTSGYWSDVYSAIDKVNANDRVLWTEQAERFAAFKRPTLVVIASEDAVCDPHKLVGLEPLFGSEYCTVRSVESGHFFANAKDTSLFDVALPEMKAFLSA